MKLTIRISDANGNFRTVELFENQSLALAPGEAVAEVLSDETEGLTIQRVAGDILVAVPAEELETDGTVSEQASDADASAVADFETSSGPAASARSDDAVAEPEVKLAATPAGDPSFPIENFAARLAGLREATAASFLDPDADRHPAEIRSELTETFRLAGQPGVTAGSARGEAPIESHLAVPAGKAASGEGPGDGSSLRAATGTAVKGEIELDVARVVFDHAPEARDFAATTDENTRMSGQIVASDPDGDPLSFHLLAGPQMGRLVLNSDGSFSFDPDGAFEALSKGETLDETFTFAVSDGEYTTQGTATITVAGSNHGPVAETSVINADQHHLTRGRLQASDADGDALEFGLVKGPEFGDLKLESDGTFSFRAGQGFRYMEAADSREVSFTYSVSDGSAVEERTATIAIGASGGAAGRGLATFIPFEKLHALGKLPGHDGSGLQSFSLTSDPGLDGFKLNHDGSFELPEGTPDGATEFTYAVTTGEKTVEHTVVIQFDALHGGVLPDAMVNENPRAGGLWHILNTSNPGLDMNVSPVWEDYHGRGVSVAVIDSGIDTDHQDLDGHYNHDKDIDARGHDHDSGAEDGRESHGTPVMGVIGAIRDGRGAIGVAPETELFGYRIGGDDVDEVRRQLSEVLANPSNADIVNSSWGFERYFEDNFNGAFAEQGRLLEQGASQGRDGLGTVFVFSAGNGGAFGQDTNLHNFHNSPYAIPVGAVGRTGDTSWFSTPGASVLVAAPGEAIFTTDQTGEAGYTMSDWGSLHGTSFAAPGVAGVVALMLEANPNLGYRDVQEILAYSAWHPTGSDAGWRTNGAGNWNGGGLGFNDDAGFGLVDAHAAVRLAETWTRQSTAANMVSITASSHPDVAIRDFELATDTIEITRAIDLDNVQVALDLDHGWIGDLIIKLISPAGTESILLARPGMGLATVENGHLDFTLSSVQFRGENTIGTWTLQILDGDRLSTGRLNSWSLIVQGDAIDPDDTYIFTKSWAEVGADAGRQTITDGEGNDTLNFAAVEEGVTIDARSGGTLYGHTIRIAEGTVIENITGGDGNDHLAGNDVANTLMGGDGNDTLEGGAGDDRVRGGDGHDLVIFSGRFEDYDFVGRDDGLIEVIDTRGSDGHDRLEDVEALSFENGLVSVRDLFDAEVAARADAAPTVSLPVSLTAGADGTLLISEAALLSGTADADGDILRVANLVVADGAGTIVDNGDSTWTFRPAEGWWGRFDLRYDVTDGLRATETSASIKVARPADSDGLPTEIDLWVGEPVARAQYDLSLDADVWHSRQGGRFETTDQGIKADGVGYRVGNDITTGTLFDFTKGGEVLAKWTPDGGNGYSYAAYGVVILSNTIPGGEGIAGATGFSTHHSWVGSTVVSEGTWYYSRIVVDADTMTVHAYTAVGNYDHLGGTIIRTTDSPLTAENWQKLEDAGIDFGFGDNYSSTSANITLGELKVTGNVAHEVEGGFNSDDPVILGYDVPLDIDPTAVDPTGLAEGLTVTLEGLPEDATLSAGTRSDDGTWTLSGDMLKNLALNLPGDQARTFQATVSASVPGTEDGEPRTETLRFGMTIGTRSDETLSGGPGDDYIYGGDGNDVLDGRGGNDILVGGKGHDSFVIDASRGGLAHVQDYSKAEGDLLELFGIAPLSEGETAEDAYHFVRADTDADGKIDDLILRARTVDDSGRAEYVDVATVADTSEPPPVLVHTDMLGA